MPVHVGTMAWDSAGAASLLMEVVDDPLTAVKPMVAVGEANDDPPSRSFVQKGDEDVAEL